MCFGHDPGGAHAGQSLGVGKLAGARVFGRGCRLTRVTDPADPTRVIAIGTSEELDAMARSMTRGYALALPQNSIWWAKNWGATIRSMIDGLVYGLLTAGTFGWLWPR